MSFKGTPGNWEMEIDSEDEQACYALIHAPSHGEIAGIVWQMEDDAYDDDKSKELRANAHCILHSPKILAALEMLLDPEIMTLNPKQTIAHAREVLALAKGEHDES